MVVDMFVDWEILSSQKILSSYENIQGDLDDYIECGDGRQDRGEEWDGEA
jgi:hypothetical protein